MGLGSWCRVDVAVHTASRVSGGFLVCGGLWWGGGCGWVGWCRVWLLVEFCIVDACIFVVHRFVPTHLPFVVGVFVVFVCLG